MSSSTPARSVYESIPTDKSVKNDSEWTTLYAKVISKTKRTSKVLTLKHPDNKEDFILADIRVFYFNGKSSRHGVCMTEFEFDYFVRYLLYDRNFEQSLENKTGARILTIKPNPKNGGVDLIQTVNDKTKRIFLNSNECKEIKDKHGSFYHMFEALDEEEEEKPTYGSTSETMDTGLGPVDEIDYPPNKKQRKDLPQSEDIRFDIPN